MRHWLLPILIPFAVPAYGFSDLPDSLDPVDNAKEGSIVAESDMTMPKGAQRIATPGPFEGLMVGPAEIGVRVLAVGENSKRLGLRRDDVIIVLNAVDVESIKSLQKIIETQADEWRMTVLRGDLRFETHLIP